MQSHIIDRYFAFVENLRTSDRILFKILLVVFIISSTVVLVRAHSALLTDVPQRGGELIEGIVGTPRFVNPVLAVTSADRDLVSLIYSGIMQLGENGALTEDLAESVTISDDGLVYNVVLRDNAQFHDGTPVTADDVIFTIARIQDPAIKSPLRASWEGVTTEKLGERELSIILPEPYAPFIENMTVGILPKHIWEFASTEEFPFSQYNSEPIGSGPYKVAQIVRSRSGIPESYILAPSENHYATAPKIEALRLNFYPNEDHLREAFIQGKITAAAGLSDRTLAAIAESDIPHVMHTAPLPRTFAVFFNQNESAVFRDRGVRRALNVLVDREALVNEIFGGYAIPIDSPIPPGFGIATSSTPPLPENANRVETAQEFLREAGWTQTESGGWEKESGTNTLNLSFSIATVNTSEFQEIANFLKRSWEEIGAVVEIRQFEQSDLTQAVIRPRQYQALLFGTEIGRELDFYSFWHSSQRNDPGLNVALYANITTDSLLADARTINDPAARGEAYAEFAEEVNAEVPAVFLFAPSLTYVVTPKVTGISLTGVAHPSERFSDIRTWYTKTESMWRIFDNRSTPDTTKDTS